MWLTPKWRKRTSQEALRGLLESHDRYRCRLHDCRAAMRSRSSVCLPRPFESLVAGSHADVEAKPAAWILKSEEDLIHDSMERVWPYLELLRQLHEACLVGFNAAGRSWNEKEREGVAGQEGSPQTFPKRTEEPRCDRSWTENQQDRVLPVCFAKRRSRCKETCIVLRVWWH